MIPFQKAVRSLDTLLSLQPNCDAYEQDGNFRIAWQAYADALELGISRDGQIKVLSNRSLAYARAGRYSEALADAERCRLNVPAV